MLHDLRSINSKIFPTKMRSLQLHLESFKLLQEDNMLFYNLYLESAIPCYGIEAFFLFLLFYNIENLFFPTPAMETLYIRFLVILFLGEANMPSWLEARKHFVGWKPGSSIEDMCLWIFKGTSCVSLSYSLCCQFRGDRKGVGRSLS